MKLRKIDLEYVGKDGFSPNFANNTRHYKTLPYISVAQAIKGRYGIQLANGDTHYTDNHGFFVAPSNIQQTVIHLSDPEDNTMSYRWVFLKIKINDLYDIDSIYDFPIIIPKEFENEMNDIFDELFDSQNVFDDYICYHKIIKLLFLMSTEKKRKIPDNLLQALDFIKANYKSQITIEDIANHVHLSQSYLFSIFKKEMGISPISYLNNYRLSIAANKLLNTQKTITEISESVGIYDSVYFNRLFRKTYQMSPSKYRKIQPYNSI